MADPSEPAQRRISLPGAPPMFVDPKLPEGWRRHLVQRQNGVSAGKYDVYIFSPSGKRFRSRTELAKYFDKEGSTNSADNFDFSAGGIDKKPSPKKKDKSKTSSKSGFLKHLNLKTKNASKVQKPKSKNASSAAKANALTKKAKSVLKKKKKINPLFPPTLTSKLVIKMNFKKTDKSEFDSQEEEEMENSLTDGKTQNGPTLQTSPPLPSKRIIGTAIFIDGNSINIEPHLSPVQSPPQKKAKSKVSVNESPVESPKSKKTQNEKSVIGTPKSKANGQNNIETQKKKETSPKKGKPSTPASSRKRTKSVNKDPDMPALEEQSPAKGRKRRKLDLKETATLAENNDDDKSKLLTPTKTTPRRSRRTTNDGATPEIPSENQKTPTRKGRGGQMSTPGKEQKPRIVKGDKDKVSEGGDKGQSKASRASISSEDEASSNEGEVCDADFHSTKPQRSGESFVSRRTRGKGPKLMVAPARFFIQPHASTHDPSSDEENSEDDYTIDPDTPVLLPIPEMPMRSEEECADLEMPVLTPIDDRVTPIDDRVPAELASPPRKSPRTPKPLLHKDFVSTMSIKKSRPETPPRKTEEMPSTSAETDYSLLSIANKTTRKKIKPKEKVPIHDEESDTVPPTVISSPSQNTSMSPIQITNSLGQINFDHDYCGEEFQQDNEEARYLSDKELSQSEDEQMPALEDKRVVSIKRDRRKCVKTVAQSVADLDYETPGGSTDVGLVHEAMKTDPSSVEGCEPNDNTSAQASESGPGDHKADEDTNSFENELPEVEVAVEDSNKDFDGFNKHVAAEGISKAVLLLSSEKDSDNTECNIKSQGKEVSEEFQECVTENQEGANEDLEMSNRSDDFESSFSQRRENQNDKDQEHSELLEKPNETVADEPMGKLDENKLSMLIKPKRIKESKDILMAEDKTVDDVPKTVVQEEDMPPLEKEPPISSKKTEFIGSIERIPIGEEKSLKDKHVKRKLHLGNEDQNRQKEGQLKKNKGNESGLIDTKHNKKIKLLKKKRKSQKKESDKNLLPSFKKARQTEQKQLLLKLEHSLSKPEGKRSSKKKSKHKESPKKPKIQKLSKFKSLNIDSDKPFGPNLSQKPSLKKTKRVDLKVDTEAAKKYTDPPRLSPTISFEDGTEKTPQKTVTLNEPDAKPPIIISSPADPNAKPLKSLLRRPSAGFVDDSTALTPETPGKSPGNGKRVTIGHVETREIDQNLSPGEPSTTFDLAALAFAPSPGKMKQKRRSSDPKSPKSPLDKRSHTTFQPPKVNVSSTSKIQQSSKSLNISKSPTTPSSPK